MGDLKPKLFIIHTFLNVHPQENNLNTKMKANQVQEERKDAPGKDRHKIKHMEMYIKTSPEGARAFHFNIQKDKMLLPCLCTLIIPRCAHTQHDDTSVG